ncbi:MAG: YbgC/FadM family acyl-CoA thioesterase [Gammaproteobacteria bacterium]
MTAAADGALEVRVYYEDTDAGGVVYYGNYARFFERARSEYMRRAGFDHRRLREEWGVLFVVRTIRMEYLRPAFLDDVLLVDARPRGRGRVFADFAQTASRGGEVLATAETRVVCVSGMPLRAAALPPPLAGTIDRHVG